MAKKIIEFYGQECPSCMRFAPKVDQLEQEEDVEVERLETWHNDENKQRQMDLQELYDKECGGNLIVPSFYDPETHRLICNPESYEELKEWVLKS